MEEYNFGSKSNISRIREALLDRELIEISPEGVYLEDPVFRVWLKNLPYFRFTEKDLPSSPKWAEMPINKGLATREVFTQHLPYTSRHSSGISEPKKRVLK